MSDKFRDPIVEQINNLLPQTQCRKCGYEGCKPYSEAIAKGEAINRCPPGGEATMQAIAELLDVEPLALTDSRHIKRYAYIRENECIGCTKCVQACPVDAILGAAKYMHTVIRDECTGCDLCVEPCPVDCIEMRPVETTLQTRYAEQDKARRSRQRFEAKQARIERLKQEMEAKRKERQAALKTQKSTDKSNSSALDPVHTAIARAKAKVAAKSSQKRSAQKTTAFLKKRLAAAKSKLALAEQHATIDSKKITALQQSVENLQQQLQTAENELHQNNRSH